MVSFVSSTFNNSRWSDPKVLLPFEQGINNLKVAFAPSQPQNSISLNKRVTHFAIGVVLSIPVVNTIVALAIKFFSPKTNQQPTPQNSQSPSPVSQQNPERKIPQWHLDVVSDPINCDTQHTIEIVNHYRVADLNKDSVRNLKAVNRSGEIIVDEECADESMANIVTINGTQTSSDGVSIKEGAGAGAMTAAHWVTLEEYNYTLTWSQLLEGMNKRSRLWE